MSPEKENMFRALKDEPLLMTSWKCRFGWHSWTKYDSPKLLKEVGFRRTVEQTKSCSSCNIMHTKITKTDLI